VSRDENILQSSDLTC